MERRCITIGGGTWSNEVYACTTTVAVAAGTTFAYTRSVQTGEAEAKVHPLLDPRKKAGRGSALAGNIVREARDSPEHPNSVPIIIAFDETGSMGGVPRALQKRLADLFELLVGKGYVQHPQLCFGAYGDLDNREVAPVQIGQFESDNRADETLDNIYLEAKGGGNNHESAAAVWYYAAKYTSTDHWESRHKRGYLFTVGDEVTGGIRADFWRQYVDPDTDLQCDLSAAEIAGLAKERWNVHHVLINNTTAHRQRSLEHYRDLLGAGNVTVLDDESAVCEAIATAVGLGEGVLVLDDVGNVVPAVAAVGSA